MPSPAELDASKMFAEVQSKDNDANLKQIQQKSDQQKAFMDKVALDKMIADQNLFFALMQKLLNDKLQKAALIEQLEQAAQRSGFPNLKEALNLAKNPDGQSPLHQAFQQQNFDQARDLMDAGAIPGPVERAAFNLALDSKAAKDFGFTPESTKELEKLHPVKNFGLVLGIKMTSKDGTYSQYGHIGPTYQLMTNAVDKYASESNNKGFKEIADAYKFSNKAAAFSDSTSQRNPAAGKEMAAHIQEGKITTIPVSFKGHAMGLSVVPDGPDSKAGYLVITNKGLGSKPGEEGTKIFRVDDLSKIDDKFINAAMNGHSNGATHEDIMGMISKVTDGKPPIHTIPQAPQTVDNCSIVNTRSNIHGIVLCQKARGKGGFDKLDTADFEKGRKEFKEFTDQMKADKVNELADAIKKNPHNSDYKDLAKEYLRTNPEVSAQLRESLENALSGKLQQSKAQEEVVFLQPPSSSLKSAQHSVAVTPELSAPSSKSSSETSPPSEELSSSDEEREEVRPM